METLTADVLAKMMGMDFGDGTEGVILLSGTARSGQPRTLALYRFDRALRMVLGLPKDRAIDMAPGVPNSVLYGVEDRIPIPLQASDEVNEQQAEASAQAARLKRETLVETWLKAQGEVPTPDKVASWAEDLLVTALTLRAARGDAKRAGQSGMGVLNPILTAEEARAQRAEVAAVGELTYDE
jgi:hypothetical protein